MRGNCMLLKIAYDRKANVYYIVCSY